MLLPHGYLPIKFASLVTKLQSHHKCCKEEMTKRKHSSHMTPVLGHMTSHSLLKKHENNINCVLKAS